MPFRREAIGRRRRDAPDAPADPDDRDAEADQADPAVRSRLADLGMDIFPRERQTQQALGALVKADVAKWWPIIKESGIKAE